MGSRQGRKTSLTAPQVRVTVQGAGSGHWGHHRPYHDTAVIRCGGGRAASWALPWGSPWRRPSAISAQAQSTGQAVAATEPGDCPAGCTAPPRPPAPSYLTDYCLSHRGGQVLTTHSQHTVSVHQNISISSPKKGQTGLEHSLQDPCSHDCQNVRT